MICIHHNNASSANNIYRCITSRSTRVQQRRRLESKLKRSRHRHNSALPCVDVFFLFPAFTVGRRVGCHNSQCCGAIHKLRIKLFCDKSILFAYSHVNVYKRPSSYSRRRRTLFQDIRCSICSCSGDCTNERFDSLSKYLHSLDR